MKVGGNVTGSDDGDSIALLGARSRLAGRRADRPPYLGIVPTESFLIAAGKDC
jgi:hypothetical protein